MGPPDFRSTLGDPQADRLDAALIILLVGLVMMVDFAIEARARRG